MFEPQTEYGNHRALNPNSVTTVVAPGATELHLVQLLSQLRQLNSGELELTTTLQQHYFKLDHWTLTRALVPIFVTPSITMILVR